MNIKPVLRRSRLKPCETINSLLLRFGRINHLDPITDIYSLCKDMNITESRASLTKPVTHRAYEKLSEFTKVPAEDLYSATIHKFASILTPPDIELADFPFGTTNLPILPLAFAARYTLSEQNVQYCPYCLGEDQYQRLYWLLPLISACTKHKCILLQCCSNCGVKVYTADLVTGKCHACEFKLSTSQVNDISQDSFGLLTQSVFMSWFADMYTNEVPETTGVPNYTPRILFRVLTGLVVAVMEAKPGWDYWRLCCKCRRG